jgi:hypothetical protein
MGSYVEVFRLKKQYFNPPRLQKSAQSAGDRSVRRPKATLKNRALIGDEGLDAFLARDLPPGSIEHAGAVVSAVLNAGARYDRYNARRLELMDYATRRRKLTTIARLSDQLGKGLCQLDILSRDTLGCLTDPRELGALVGSLQLLNLKSTIMALETQDNGRPRDLAEECWILEMADIYENAFCREAKLSGSGNDPRGKFYHFLKCGLPPSFARYGKLHLRHVKRALAKRVKRSPSFPPWKSRTAAEEQSNTPV